MHEVLDELAAEHPSQAGVVKLRYFAGMTNEETAQVMGVSVATLKTYGTFARTWIFHEIKNSCNALDWRQLLECAGRAQRRRRFGFPARGSVEAGFPRSACAESKAAWRFASRRTPKCARPFTRVGTIPQLVGGCAKHIPYFGRRTPSVHRPIFKPVLNVRISPS